METSQTITHSKLSHTESQYYIAPRSLGLKNDPLQVIRTRKATHGRPATIAGPMVRYSKIAFRQTVRHHNVDIVYTPMMLAREYVRNRHARLTDFSTTKDDTPLIVQVGCNNVTDLLKFVEMVSPYCDGIGINCGCPIREQVREGIGCALIYNPKLLSEMVSSVKSKYGDKVRIETKIRIHDQWDETVSLCYSLAESGVDWITIHGRKRSTRSSEPVNIDAMRYIMTKIKSQYPDLPLVANGDCFHYEDIQKFADILPIDGIMSARGILKNPALFDGAPHCPWGCIERFWYYAVEIGGLPFQLAQHHFHCMLDDMGIRRRLLAELMRTKSYSEMLDWFDDHFDLRREGEHLYGERDEVPYKNINESRLSRDSKQHTSCVKLDDDANVVNLKFDDRILDENSIITNTSKLTI